MSDTGLPIGIGAACASRNGDSRRADPGKLPGRPRSGQGRGPYPWKDGSEELLIDTGFTGAIALPRRLLRRLRLEFVAIDSFTLATGEMVDLPAYTGMARIGRRRVRTWFIPGDRLIGMDFLRSVYSRLVLDFETDSVTLQ